MPRADVAALVLAAGAGTRLRPLTTIRPKPLCPVDNVPLIDLALQEVTALLGLVGPDRLAVNANHLAEQIVGHIGDRATLSVERPVALGTAGAIGRLRDWVDGRAILVRNTDVWRSEAVPQAFLDDWDRLRPRLLVFADEARADFAGGWRHAGLSL